MKLIKVINSHAGLARFLNECDDDPIGWMPRSAVAAIPSPYAYSPVKAMWLWKGDIVFYSEVSHRRYEVYQAPEGRLYESPEAAEEAEFKKEEIA